jgi:hypothetical protein
MTQLNVAAGLTAAGPVILNVPDIIHMAPDRRKTIVPEEKQVIESVAIGFSPPVNISGKR